jgi:GntR family transcriptional regulator, transcriptional repressor for pyruvate dehydrogenase complex
VNVTVWRGAAGEGGASLGADALLDPDATPDPSAHPSAHPGARPEPPTPTLDHAASLEAVFAPVRSITAFEETVERLGIAIRLGLLPPGTRLPAERELCRRLGIARSTLRQALLALGQSGHLRATRGRRGGTFIADPLPPAEPPRREALNEWHSTCDGRLAVEVGIAALAAERASAESLANLDRLADALDSMLDDFTQYRPADVRLHVGLAEATANPRLVASMTETQGAMSELIDLIPHPPEVLAVANAQHHRLVAALHRRDSVAAAREMAEHVRGTEHILAGLLPDWVPAERTEPVDGKRPAIQRARLTSTRTRARLRR